MLKISKEFAVPKSTKRIVSLFSGLNIKKASKKSTQLIKKSSLID
jgi:hypothetical protein